MDALCDSIPVVFIGRNNDGFWVARNETGSVGGLFLFRRSALRFARTISPEGCALVLPTERFELDTTNRGNPVLGRNTAAPVRNVGSVPPGNVKRRCIRILRRLYERTAVLGGRFRAR
jgi:hypothetical protein